MEKTWYTFVLVLLSDALVEYSKTFKKKLIQMDKIIPNIKADISDDSGYSDDMHNTSKDSENSDEYIRIHLDYIV